MGDLPNKDKGEFTIVDPNFNDRELFVNADHSAHVDIRNVGGAGIGQKQMVASVPVVLASDQSAIPVTTNPATPPDRTGISVSGTSVVARLGGTATTSYLIPNGETADLLSFAFGGYMPTNTSAPLNTKCELFYRPNGAGNTTGQVRLFTLYLQNTAFSREPFNAGEIEYVGDGTAVFEMVITNWSQNAAELFRQIRGYY